MARTGFWSGGDEKRLVDLKAAVNADYVARTFHEAADIILKEATAGQRTPVVTPSE